MQLITTTTTTNNNNNNNTNTNNNKIITYDGDEKACESHTSLDPDIHIWHGCRQTNICTCIYDNISLSLSLSLSNIYIYIYIYNMPELTLSLHKNTSEVSNPL